MRTEDFEWSRADERGLARYVRPRHLPNEFQLTGINHNRHDLVTANEEKVIASQLYTRIRDQAIQYDTASYHERPGVKQNIRKPEKILDRKEGTCLDLSVLFAAMCLERGLLPLIVVVQNHAFVGVSSDRTRQEAEKRAKGYFAWDRGKLTSLDALQKLGEEGWLFVECTGAAQSQSLSPEFPEGRGRDESGCMSFERACDAGYEQVSDHLVPETEGHSPGKRVFFYALDIHDLHVNQGFEPVDDVSEKDSFSKREADDDLYKHVIVPNTHVNRRGILNTIRRIFKRSGVERLVTVPPRPRHYIDRPKVIGELKASILKSEISPAANTGTGIIGLQGKGGIGKTVLAAALARDKSIGRKFPDGIIWLTIGQRPDIITRQKQLAVAIGVLDLPIRDSPYGKTVLERLLADRRCLVILDDVWKPEHVEPFNCLGKKSRLLIITTNKEIFSRLDAEIHQLDGLEPYQALELLGRWSGQSARDLPKEALQVAQKCDYLPLALAMVGALVRQDPESESWKHALHLLQNAELDKVRFPGADDSLLAALDISVLALPKTPIDLKACYESLAVFLEDTPISRKTLQVFWAGMGLINNDVHFAAQALEDRNLARIDKKNGDLSLHNLQYAYLRFRTKNIFTLHQRFLQAYTKFLLTSVPVPWHKIPSEDLYTWKHLTYHMVQAEEWDSAFQLLINFDFLQTKCKVTSVYDLEEDYHRVINAGQEGSEESRKILSQLEERLRLESHHIARAPELLFSILYNYLSWPNNVEENPLYEICTRAAENRNNWLKSTQNPQPEPSLWEISLFEGHTESVNAVAVTPDGEKVISGSSDKTVKVWDLTSGRLLHSLVSHTGDVTALAMVANGEHVISGSNDETVKIWDLSSGRLLRSLEEHAGSINALAATPGGNRIISGSADNTMKVWNPTSGRLLRSLEDKILFVSALVVTPSGESVVSGSEYGLLMLWDWSEGTWNLLGSREEPGRWELSRNRKQAVGYINALAMTPDGEQIILGASDKTITVWNLSSDEPRLLPPKGPTGHTGPINSLAVTPDGKQLISGSSDSTMKVWDMSSGKLLHDLTGHTRHVNALAVTPDGKQVISGSSDKAITVWDLSSGRLLHSLSGYIRDATALAVTPDGKQVIAGYSDKTLRIWDLSSGRLLGTLDGHINAINAVAITPDGKQVISGSSDHTIKVWNLSSGELLHSLEGHTGAVTALAITPDGKTLVSAGTWDQTVKIWDLLSGRLLHSLSGHIRDVNAVAVTPDGKKIISGSSDTTMKIWNLRSGRLLLSLEGHDGYVNTVAVTPNGKQVISGSSDKTVKVWNLQSGRLRRTLNENGVVRAVVVTLDGERIVSGSNDQTVKVWDLSSGKLLHSFQGHTGGVTALAMTPSGKQVISGSNDQTVKVWNLSLDRRLRSLEGHTRPVNALALTPDGRQVISGSPDRTVKIWKRSSGRLLRTFTGHTRDLNPLIVMPDGIRVISASKDKTVNLWDLCSGKRLYSLTGHRGNITALAVTPDGEKIVSGSDDGGVIDWQWLERQPIHSMDLIGGTETREEDQVISEPSYQTIAGWQWFGTPLHRLEGHRGNITALAVTPDGEKIISGSNDRTAKIWNSASSSMLHDLKGHTGSVNALVVTPDGKQVISGSSDNTIKIWDLSSGKFRQEIGRHDRYVNGLALTSDGKQIISGSSDKTVRVWDLNTGNSTVLFWNDCAIRSLALSRDGHWLTVGDDQGRVWIFEWIK